MLEAPAHEDAFAYVFLGVAVHLRWQTPARMCRLQSHSLTSQNGHATSKSRSLPHKRLQGAIRACALIQVWLHLLAIYSAVPQPGLLL